ncbi:glycosyltransferase family 4 protein [Microbacterium sp. W1N]|uniref:glycosyltransferase family 4 protein n=1 Tax=Microbacterium festucae TaxID=2977531 RepID=UPI0021BEE380|nr:glycosyltransferase family 4 protein [Microbacterium festucae]MCT9819030.1 glycosyltransferase family 4 protein [Microbacterium festucae]
MALRELEKRLTSDGSSSTRVLRLLVASPWGTSEAYSGPVVLQNRLFGTLGRADGVQIDLLYRARDTSSRSEPWATRADRMLIARTLGLVSQMVWALRVACVLSLRRGRYDYIHLHGAYLLNLLPALFADRKAKLLILPVLEAGDLNLANGGFRNLKVAIARRVLRRAHTVFALSDGIAAEARLYGVEDGRIVRIGNPVSDEFAVDRRVRDARPFRLLFCGKLGPVKQPHRVLIAMKGLLDDGVDVESVFIGPYVDDEYKIFFEGLLASLNLTSRVTLLGFVSDVSAEYMRELDAFVLPSKAEGLPGALSEAMFSALPVVVSNAGAMGEIVEDSAAGFVVGDDASLVAALRCLAADAEVWTRMSTNARAYAVREFSLLAVSTRYLSRL